jgi:hypothetical protein
MGRFTFGIALIGVASVSFFFFLALVDDRQSVIPAPQSIGAPDPGTRCEIWFSSERCPAQPSLKGIDAYGRLIDSYDGADRSPERCLKRAAEFFSWCKLSGSIKVAFVRNGQIVMEKRYP